MNDHKKTNEDPIKELQELRQEHNSLRNLYNKDLSESKLTEKQLVKRENQFNLMFENAPMS